MKLSLLAAAVAALALGAGTVAAQDMTSEKGKLSYALGYDAGTDLARLIASGEQLDSASAAKGLQDAMAQKQPAIPAEQLRPVFENFQKRQQARAQEAKAKWDKAASENMAKSNQFMLANKAKAGVKTLPDGAQYRVLQTGNGAKPTMASTVELVVSGPYPWGEKPTPVPAGRQIPSIKVSAVEMPAMREVLTQMSAGSKWEVALPPPMAYGADPRSGFPPNVAVVFEVHLVSVK